MKKLLIVLGALIALLAAAIIIVPIVLKEPITKAVKEEANRNLNATIDFKDVNISLLWSFPDLYVGVEELTVTGKEKFDGITLLYLNALELDVDLMSAFDGTPTVNRITLANGLANVLVMKDGAANYDIVPESEAAAEEPKAETEGGAFAIRMNEFAIKNLQIKYNDLQGDMAFETKALDLTLSGDLSADRTNINTEILLKEVLVRSGGVSYLNNAELELTAGVDADLANSSYVLKKNTLRVNGLHLNLDGTVAMPNDEDITMDLTYGAAKTDFKEILSLVPAIYMNDFEDVKASGKLALSGMLKGTYNEQTIPGFTANLQVEDGQFQYPDLPKSVNAIQVDLEVTNPGGDADNTVIDLRQFNFLLGENPFNVKANVKTPISDPNIDASLKGKIDLNSLAEAIPMEEGDQLSGTIIADAELKGRQSDLDKGRYDRFDAKGEFILMEILYTTAGLAVPVEVKYAQFKFAPRFLELASFDAKAGRSDFKMNGKITNYLGYIMSDGLLKGDFTFQSTLIDGNELSGLSTQEPAAEEAAEEGQSESSADEPFQIPDNLDVTLNTDIGKVVYDDMELADLKGKVVLRKSKADLKNLSFKTLGGSIGMNGYYDSHDQAHPDVHYYLDVKDVVVKEAYRTFVTVQKLAPIGEKTEGRVSVKFDVAGKMESATALDLNSLNGSGRLTSPSLKITGTEALNKIAQVVKINAFKNPEVKDVNLSFAFVDGRVTVQPFDVKIGPVSTNVAGSHGFDETMDYILGTSVPTSALGDQANSVINGLVSQANSLGANFTAGSTIDVDILVQGTFAKPKITPSFKGSGKSAADDLKKQAEEELKRQKEELERKAREEAERLQRQAEEEAERMKREAEERARKEAERLKKEAEERAKKEAGDKLKGLFGKPK